MRLTLLSLLALSATTTLAAVVTPASNDIVTPMKRAPIINQERPSSGSGSVITTDDRTCALKCGINATGVDGKKRDLLRRELRSAIDEHLADEDDLEKRGWLCDVCRRSLGDEESS